MKRFDRPGWHPHPPLRHWTHGRRFVFGRFAMGFGAIVLAFLVVLAVLRYFIVPILPVHPERTPLAPVFFFCIGPLAFLLVVALVAGWAFRRIGTPLADLISATDSIARGDLDVRVPENIPGEIGQLARRFNHMTGELQRAEQQRRNLTVDIAHELRTPLHVIQGNLEGMLDGVYEPNPENITDTLDETKLLARLVNDLQTLSLAEAGQLPLHPTRFLLADLLADAAASFVPQAAAQGVELRVEVAEPAQALELSADCDRLDQVLCNLVSNALRYTPSGGRIALRGEATPDGARLVVADNGTGIPPEDLPYIFDRFWRGDRARQRTEGAGSGLGLAIAKQLVQAHDGTLYAESQPGQGTTFTIELPVG